MMLILMLLLRADTADANFNAVYLILMLFIRADTTDAVSYAAYTAETIDADSHAFYQCGSSPT